MLMIQVLDVKSCGTRVTSLKAFRFPLPLFTSISPCDLPTCSVSPPICLLHGFVRRVVDV